MQRLNRAWRGRLLELLYFRTVAAASHQSRRQVLVAVGLKDVLDSSAFLGRELRVDDAISAMIDDKRLTVIREEAAVMC